MGIFGQTIVCQMKIKRARDKPRDLEITVLKSLEAFYEMDY